MRKKPNKLTIDGATLRGNIIGVHVEGADLNLDLKDIQFENNNTDVSSAKLRSLNVDGCNFEGTARDQEA